MVSGLPREEGREETLGGHLEWRMKEGVESPLVDFSEAVEHSESEHEGFDGLQVLLSYM